MIQHLFVAVIALGVLIAIFMSLLYYENKKTEIHNTGKKVSKAELAAFVIAIVFALACLTATSLKEIVSTSPHFQNNQDLFTAVLAYTITLALFLSATIIAWALTKKERRKLETKP